MGGNGGGIAAILGDVFIAESDECFRHQNSTVWEKSMDLLALQAKSESSSLERGKMGRRKLMFRACRKTVGGYTNFSGAGENCSWEQPG